MSKRNTARIVPTPLPTVTQPTQLGWQFVVWALFFVNSLFILKGCMDESLVPRFFFTAGVLLIGSIILRKKIWVGGDHCLFLFDWIFLLWLGINWASVAWAFNWAEAVFYTQKVLLTFLTYWIFRQALYQQEKLVSSIMAKATPLLTGIVITIILVQLATAIRQVGLENDALYEYLKGLYGNKGLAANFLFFLLIFNVLVRKDLKWQWLFWVQICLLLLLILLLQTRTVYLATVAAGLFFLLGRVLSEPDFRPVFLKKILPFGLVLSLILGSLLAWKGRGTSLTERLNPTTYLQSASANERRFVWYKTDLLNAEHPLFGVGNGSWKIYFPAKNIEGAYRLQERGVIFTRVHNDYLEIRAELGLVGAIIFISLFLAIAAAVMWSLKNAQGAATRQQLLALSAGVLGYSVIQFFDFPRERMEQQVVLAIFWAWTISLTRPFWEKMPLRTNARNIFHPAWALALAGLFFSLVIGANRIVGERHNLKALEAQAKKDHDGMIREALAAENTFYQLSDVVLPMAWLAGIGHFQKGEISAAETQFARAFEQNPYSFQVMNNYAAALTKSEKYAEAIPLFEKTLEINPRYDEGKFNLSYAYFQLGDFNKAIEYVQQVDTIVGAKTPEELKKNAVILKRKDDFLRVIQQKMANTGQ